MSQMKHTLLLVSHLQRNLQLLSDALVEEGYATIAVSSYEEFDQFLSQQYAIDGGLIDIAGFDQRIWERCEQLREAKIPFLVFSPKQSAAIQQASLSHGARGVMVKPLVLKELIGIIKSILEA